MPKKMILFLAVTAGLSILVTASGQESVDIVKVRHRVVFVDVLVKDKKTSAPAADLDRHDFEVLADGKPRTISYFAREGDAGRRPLAIVLVLDLRRDGAGRFLRRTEILEAMMAVLSRLPPEDEVAVVALKAGGSNDKHEWLTDFTNDRAQVISALTLTPMLVAEGSSEESASAPQSSSDKSPESGKAKTDGTTKTKSKKESKGSASAVTDVPIGNEKDEIESETRMAGADGSTVVRTVYRSGKVTSKRVSKSGSVTIDMDDDLDLGTAASEAAAQATKERPNSQGVMVWISDGVAPIFYVERDYAVTSLVRSNIPFSALVADMKTGYKLFMPVLKPLGNMVGLNIYGAAQYVAKQTGGEAVRVRRPEDYAQGLSRILGSLTSRYSLGFTLTDIERDDGKMHSLEVRVNARDAKGNLRKLSATFRLGYYMPKESESASAH